MQNVVRNVWLSFVTLSIFLLTLLTVNAVIFLNVIGTNALEVIEQKVEVTIYFESEASEGVVQAAQGYLLGMSQVLDVMLLTADESLEAFTERHADDESILASLDEVDGNPFGHALVVRAESSDDFEYILEAIETPEFSGYIKEKDYSDYEQVIERIESLSTRMRIGGMILAAFFVLIAVMIIFNTIRVAIYVHREEIGIMKLVGANDWFVRAPFLVEALLYSLIATLVVAGLTMLALNFVTPYVISYFGDIDVNPFKYFWDSGLLIFGAQFVGMSILSLVTTWIAMSRYLKT